VNQNFRAPYFYNYSLQLEKSLGNASVIQIGYVGSQARKLNVMTNINGNGELAAQYPMLGTFCRKTALAHLITIPSSNVQTPELARTILASWVYVVALS